MSSISSSSQITFFNPPPISLTTPTTAASAASAVAKSISKEAEDFFAHIKQSTNIQNNDKWAAEAIKKLKSSSNANALVTTTDSEGNTAYHYVCGTEFENYALVKEMFKLGARPDIRNNAGRTPLHCSLLFKSAAAINSTLPEYITKLRLQYESPPLQTLFIQMIDEHTQNKLPIATVNTIIFDYARSTVADFMNEVYQPANSTAAAVPSIMEEGVLRSEITDGNTTTDDQPYLVENFRDFGGDSNKTSVSFPNSTIKQVLTDLKNKQKIAFRTFDLTSEQVKRYQQVISDPNSEFDLITRMRTELGCNFSAPFIGDSVVKHILMGTLRDEDDFIVHFFTDLSGYSHNVYSEMLRIEKIFKSEIKHSLYSSSHIADIITKKHHQIKLQGPAGQRKCSVFIQCNEPPKLAVMMPIYSERIAEILSEGPPSSTAASSAITVEEET